jgi:hypothetical protein
MSLLSLLSLTGRIAIFHGIMGRHFMGGVTGLFGKGRMQYAPTGTGGGIMSLLTLLSLMGRVAIFRAASWGCAEKGDRKGRPYGFYRL